MAKHVAYYVSGDELSEEVVKVFEGLVKSLGKRVKVSYSGFIGSTVTRIKVALESSLGGRDELEIEVNAVAEGYEDTFKARLGLKGFPAARFGDETHYGEAASSLASTLSSLLTGPETPTFEQVIYKLTSATEELSKPRKVKKPVKEVEEAPKPPPVPPAPREHVRGVGVYGDAFMERLRKLEKLYREGKITREQYERMRRQLEEIFKGGGLR